MASYDVLYIDPPWPYRNIKTGGSHTSGSAQKYRTLSLQQLWNLPVGAMAAKDSVLFLWATTPLGMDPYTVMNAYGFSFKTKVYWHKTGRLGTGYWLRGEVEELLIGTRGTVKAWRSSVRNWVEFEEAAEDCSGVAHPVLGHSQKPDKFHRLIESLTPNARRVDLFATEHSQRCALFPTDGTWDAFGLDLGHDFTDPDFWTPWVAPAEDAVVPTLGDA